MKKVRPFMSSKVQKLIDNYNEWSVTSDHVLQLSYPRSGRHWLTRLMQEITGCRGYEIDIVQALVDNWYADLPVYPYLTSHGSYDYQYCDHVKYVVLIRDPRDIITEQFLRIDKNKTWRGLYGVGITNPAEHFSYQMLEEVYKVLVLEKDVLLVQFEKLCLFPVVELTRLLNFINYRAVQPIKDSVDKYDGHYVSPIKTQWRQVPAWNSGLDRYNHFCLLWQRNRRLTRDDLDSIWNVMEAEMVKFGYTRDGHSKELLGCR